MKVRLLTSIASADFSYEPGSVQEFDNDTAKRLLESGQAEPVADKPAARSEKRAPAKGEKRA